MWCGRNIKRLATSSVTAALTGRITQNHLVHCTKYYRDYLARQGVYSTIRRPRIELLETGQGSPFWRALYAIKARAQRTIAQILPEPYAALLTGILLGVEVGIPRDLYD